MNQRIQVARPFAQPAVEGAVGRRRRAGALPPVGFIAYVGSSSAFQTSLYNTGSNNRTIYGDGYGSHALWRAGGGIGLLRDPANSNAMHFGQTGAFMSGLLATGAQYDDAIAQAVAAYNATGLATLILTQPGLNDIGRLDSVASIQASIESVMTKCEAAGKAVRLAITKAWPRLSTEASASSVLARRLEVNAMLDTVVRQRGHGLIETADVGDRGDGFVNPTWVDAVSPGHAAMPFASRASNIIHAWMAQNLTWPAFDTADVIATAANGSRAYLTGTGGSGGRPTGWSTGNNGASTHTWTTVDYGDGTGRKWLRLTCNANGGNGTVQAAETAGVTSGFTTGDRIDAVCDVRFPQSSGFAIGSVRLEVLWTPTFSNALAGFPRVTEQSPPVAMEWHGDTLRLRACPALVPAGATGFFLKVYASGTGVVDFGSIMLFINSPDLPPYYPAL